nr:retrovirus-related Pol polyprotein from transposon TNT 1-94 [Tanacetum cinerariifolium]
DFQENSDDEVNERSSEEYLRDLDIEFHDLENSKRFKKKEIIFLVKKQRKTLNVTNVAKRTKGLVAKTFDWDEKEVSDDEEVTQAKVLMALADDEIIVGKNHACNDEWIDITMRKILKAKAKPFPPCTHCDFNDHRLDDCRNYPGCEIYRSYDHFPLRYNRVIHIKGGVLAESSQSSKSSIGVKCNTCGSTIHSTTDHNKFDYFKRGYSFVSKAFRVFNTRRQQVEETYHVTFDESMEAIRFTNTLVNEIGIDDSSRYPPDEFIHDDDPSRQYQANSGPPDLINIEGTHEQNVQDEQIITNPLKDRVEKFDAKADDGYFLGYSFVSKAFRVFNTRRQQVEETYHVTFDESMEAIRFTNTLVNEIGIDDSSRYPPDEFIHEDDPSRQYQANSGMHTRSMAAKLTATLASECVFVDFVSEIKLKKVSEVRPLKEYTIKFPVMNGKNPLTFDFITFIESTRLDYAKDAYVSPPSPKVVKAKLANIVENPILLDKTPVLKTAFSLAGRILFIFVIQDESFGSSPTILSNSNFSKDPSKVTPSELTAFMVDSQGPKASRSLPQKRKKLKSKKPPIETKVTPPPSQQRILSNPIQTGAEYQVDETQSTRLRYQTLTKNKGKTSSEAESGLETLQLTTLADIQAYLLFKDELVQASDKEEVFVAGDDIEEDTQVDKE